MQHKAVNSTVMPKFTQDELIERAFLRLARVLYEQWEEFGGGDTRLFDWLIHPDYVYVGTSLKGGEYREHLVPRAIIRDECLKLFDSGVSVEEVAKSIRVNLKVAKISKQEAKHIDWELGLRTTMPNGWTYASGDYMARLRAGNVVLKPKKLVLATEEQPEHSSSL